MHASLFPRVRDIAHDLGILQREVDWDAIEPDDQGERFIDVRLQVVDGGSWRIHEGDPCYDTDHSGFWGACSIGKDMDSKALREIAQDLKDQALDSAAQCDELEENPVQEGD